MKSEFEIRRLYNLYSKQANNALLAKLELRKDLPDYAQRRDRLSVAFSSAQSSANALSQVLDSTPMTEDDYRWLFTDCG